MSAVQMQPSHFAQEIYRSEKGRYLLHEQATDSSTHQHQQTQTYMYKLQVQSSWLGVQTHSDSKVSA